MPVAIAERERRARRLLTPEIYDYYAGGPDASGHCGPMAGRGGGTGSKMALAGARTLTGIAGVTGPATAHSLDT